MSRAVMQQTLEAYLSCEMPAGTVIGDPKWWAPKIAAALESALAQPEQGWRLVPDVPTREWVNNLTKTQTGSLEDVSFAEIHLCITELLEAAPQPDHIANAGKKVERFAADGKPMQPAQEPVACLVGIKGSVFDLPTTKRAYTYAEQPGNVVASRLGRSCDAAALQSAGDGIDRGLALLQELQKEGFGVFNLGAEYAAAPEPLAQPEQKPVKFLAYGSRFKISYDKRQSSGKIDCIPAELGGRWVALVAAEDDCHLNLLSPPRRQEEQEPIAYLDPKGLAKLQNCNGMSIWAESHKIHADMPEVTALALTAVYTAPPAQELVAWGVDWGRNGDRSCVSIVKKHPGGHIEVVATENDPKPSHPPRHQPMRRATIEDARDYLNTNDKAMWAIGWNECVEAYSIKGAT